MSFIEVKSELSKFSNAQKAKVLATFFKTGKGEYGEGDLFLGVKVPDQRKVARKFKNLALRDVKRLLQSKIHDYRFTALVILIKQFEKGNEDLKKKIFNFYLDNVEYVNSWDLVDLSAPKIVGAYLLDKGPIQRKFLYNFARSNDLWKRRIAILATFAFIKEKDFEDALEIAEILVDDEHDLIHKVVGWMLREIGKIDQWVEEKFLRKHYKTMPRTMLRYAIEKFDTHKKNFYMGR